MRMAKFSFGKRLVPLLLLATASLVGLLKNKGQLPAGLFSFVQEKSSANATKNGHQQSGLAVIEGEEELSVNTTISDGGVDMEETPSFINTTTAVNGREKLSSSTKNPTGMADFVHLFNPFRVSNCKEPFCPYDQAQSVAIASMLRAQAQAQRNNLSVVLTAVTFPDELDIIPDGFVALPPLQRSTATEYPNMGIKGVPRRLPFWQDILHSLIQDPQSQSSPNNMPQVRAQTIVYTNSDIILHEDFYTTAHHIIVNKSLPSFSINRQTVAPKNITTNQLYTANDLEEIFQIPMKDRYAHAGYDCFVFPWDSASLLDLGNIFVGYPPMGTALLVQLQDVTPQGNNKYKHGFRRFRSYDPRTTFHLGLDKVWKSDADHKAYRALNEGIADNLTNAPSWRHILGRHSKRKNAPE